MKTLPTPTARGQNVPVGCIQAMPATCRSAALGEHARANEIPTWLAVCDNDNSCPNGGHLPLLEGTKLLGDSSQKLGTIDFPYKLPGLRFGDGSF